MVKLYRVVVALMVGFVSISAAAAELQWFGQSAFKITTDAGKVILIDPFITQNPKTPDALKNLEKLGKVDLILVTHGHGDHMGDTAAIAKMTGAKVAMNADMGTTVQALGIVPKEQLIRFNKGNVITPIGQDVHVTMVHAEHSSSIKHKNADTGKIEIHPGGEPAGYVIALKPEGQTLYHAGDTGVFGDMIFIARYYRPDYALLPIGGHFTMDPLHAAYALDGLLQTPKVIPMHYGTFPLLTGTPAEFRAALRGESEVLEMAPGDVISLQD